MTTQADKLAKVLRMLRDDEIGRDKIGLIVKRDFIINEINEALAEYEQSKHGVKITDKNGEIVTGEFVTEVWSMESDTLKVELCDAKQALGDETGLHTFAQPKHIKDIVYIAERLEKENASLKIELYNANNADIAEAMKALEDLDKIKRTFVVLVNMGDISHEYIDYDWIETIRKALRHPVPEVVSVDDVMQKTKVNNFNYICFLNQIVKKYPNGIIIK